MVLADCSKRSHELEIIDAPQIFVCDRHTSGTTPETLPHLFLCGIPMEIFVKGFKAKERQGKAIREMPPRLSRAPDSSATAGL